MCPKSNPLKILCMPQFLATSMLIKLQKCNMQTSLIVYMMFLWHSTAANYAVCVCIWQKSELIQGYMHVRVPGKIKKAPINSDREKVETSIFVDAQGQLTW